MNHRGLAIVVGLVLLVGLGWLLLAGGESTSTTLPPGPTAPAAVAPKDEPAAGSKSKAGRPWALRGTGAVEGILREYGTDRALGGVRILLAAGTPGPGVTLETTTLADGSFLIEKAPNFETWTLTAKTAAPLAELEVAGVEVIETRVTDLGVIYATPGFTVPGIVVDEAGKPIPGATVRAMRTRPVGVQMDFLRIIRELPRQQPAVDSATTDGDGRFVLKKLAPGAYDLEAAAKEYRLTVEREILVSPDSKDREIRIVLAKGYVLKGRVVRRTEGPIEGLRVVCSAQPQNDRDMFSMFAKSLATTDESGEFVLEGLGPGTHFVGVEAPNEPYHLAVNVEIPRDGWLEIVIEGDASLEGVVRDAAGTPIPSAQVYCLNFRSSTPMIGTAVTDGEGRYRMHSLKSGPVQLFMVEAKGFGTYPEDFLTLMRGSGSELILKPGKNEKDVTLGKGGIVRGVVTEQGSGTPVEGVRVSLAGPASMFGGQRSGTSDAAGKFEITSVPVGGALLVASKDGWVQPGLSPQTMLMNVGKIFQGGASTDSGEGIVVVIAKPGDVVERTLELARGTMIRGTVTTPDGKPVTGAKVSVEFASSGGGFMRQIQAFFPLGEARLSGAEGVFELPSPPAGQKVAVVARAQGYLEGRTEDLMTKPGEALEGVVVKLRQGASIEGKVTGPEGKPIDGAMVRFTPQEGKDDWGRRWRLRSARPQRTGSDGSYRIDHVEPGKLTIQFSHPSFVSASRDNVETSDGTATEVSVELGAALAIAGKVVGADGKPYAGARISVARSEPIPAGADPYFQPPEGIATSGDGSFSLPGLLPGKYRVTATADGSADSDPVEVEAGGPAVSLRLGAAYTISGIVRSRQGGPLSNVRIRATREGGNGENESANTNRDGRFEVRDLAAGTYEVLAEAGWGAGSSRPNLIPAKVSGVTAGTQDLLIEVEEGLRISGVVLLGDGTPVAEGWANANQVMKAGDKGAPVSASGPVLDGKFDLAGLVPGRYTVGVGGNNLPYKTVQADAGASDVKIQYGQGGSIEGRVRRADGTSAAQVWVGANGPDGSAGDQTDADGKFLIEEVPNGTYTVGANWQSADGKTHQQGAVPNVSVSAGSVTGGVEIDLKEIVVPKAAGGD
jgi:protocatechuate 3,4-dioxygenase beta subunit